jgi:hypothetical protein
MVFGKEYRVHVQEVIPMKNRAYRAVDVNRVDKELASLDLRETLVADTGMKELYSLKMLTLLHIPRRGVTNAGYQELVKALPRRMLYFHGKPGP